MKSRINSTYKNKILVTGSNKDINTIKDNELLLVNNNNSNLPDVYIKHNNKVIKKTNVSTNKKK